MADAPFFNGLLDHPNLVEVLAYEDNDGSSAFAGKGGPKNPFIVMELGGKKTLESLIKQSRGPYNVTQQSVQIAIRVCEALEYLHARRMVHRDVKPANVFLSTIEVGRTPARVKLGDFGVLKWGDFKAALTTGTLTMTGQSGLGTLKYMSPEQAIAARDVTVRSDMWSFGILLFELFTAQILANPHHVFELSHIARNRGHVGAKLVEIGIPAVPEHDLMWDSILHMMLAARSRPTSRRMIGQLKYVLGTL